jgi:hypothetical protein
MDYGKSLRQNCWRLHYLHITRFGIKPFCWIPPNFYLHFSRIRSTIGCAIWIFKSCVCVTVCFLVQNIIKRNFGSIVILTYKYFQNTAMTSLELPIISFNNRLWIQQWSFVRSWWCGTLNAYKTLPR